jgi:uncharacterized protein YneF (UPF0154 family)
MSPAEWVWIVIGVIVLVVFVVFLISGLWYAARDNFRKDLVDEYRFESQRRDLERMYAVLRERGML